MCEELGKGGWAASTMGIRSSLDRAGTSCAFMGLGDFFFYFKGCTWASGALLPPALSIRIWNKHWVSSAMSTTQDDGKWWEALLCSLCLHCCVSGISLRQERFNLTWGFRRPHSIQTGKPERVAQSIVSEAGSWGILCHGTLASKDRWSLNQGFLLNNLSLVLFIKAMLPTEKQHAKQEPEETTSSSSHSTLPTYSCLWSQNLNGWGRRIMNISWTWTA